MRWLRWTDKDVPVILKNQLSNHPVSLPIYFWSCFHKKENRQGWASSQSSQNWKQSKKPLTEKQTRKTWYFCAVRYPLPLIQVWTHLQGECFFQIYLFEGKWQNTRLRANEISFMCWFSTQKATITTEETWYSQGLEMDPGLFLGRESSSTWAITRGLRCMTARRWIWSRRARKPNAPQIWEVRRPGWASISSTHSRLILNSVNSACGCIWSYMNWSDG